MSVGITNQLADYTDEQLKEYIKQRFGFALNMEGCMFFSIFKKLTLFKTLESLLIYLNSLLATRARESNLLSDRLDDSFNNRSIISSNFNIANDSSLDNSSLASIPRNNLVSQGLLMVCYICRDEDVKVGI